MRALVLGASGFIGGAIAEAAIRRGDEVVALVRRGSEARVPTGVTTHVGSIFDPNAIARAAEGAEVVYFAVGTVEAGLSAAAYRWLHVAALENALAAARHAGARRLVLVSCADVTLAEHERVHWDEKRDIAGEPLGARAQSLRLAEEIALASSDETLSVVSLRPGWVWGRGDRSRLPGLIREARTGGLRMYGDGRTLLSTTHVSLVSDAALAAARYPGAAGQSYYLTDVELLELRELFGALSKGLELPPPSTGMPGPVASLLGRVGAGAPRDVIAARRFSTHFNAEKARTELSLEPSVTLELGIRELTAWVKEVGLETVASFRRPPIDPAAIERELAEAPR